MSKSLTFTLAELDAMEDALDEKFGDFAWSDYDESDTWGDEAKRVALGEALDKVRKARIALSEARLTRS